jgi:hypothetical protein
MLAWCRVPVPVHTRASHVGAHVYLRCRVCVEGAGLLRCVGSICRCTDLLPAGFSPDALFTHARLCTHTHTWGQVAPQFPPQCPMRAGGPKDQCVGSGEECELCLSGNGFCKPTGGSLSVSETYQTQKTCHTRDLSLPEALNPRL